MKKIKAFILGISEFRLSCTTSYDDDDLINTYDAGREFAHRVTFRKWDR